VIVPVLLTLPCSTAVHSSVLIIITLLFSTVKFHMTHYFMQRQRHVCFSVRAGAHTQLPLNLYASLFFYCYRDLLQGRLLEVEFSSLVEALLSDFVRGIAFHTLRIPSRLQCATIPSMSYGRSGSDASSCRVQPCTHCIVCSRSTLHCFFA
jgi:hypothetical protein